MAAGGHFSLTPICTDFVAGFVATQSKRSKVFFFVLFLLRRRRLCFFQCFPMQLQLVTARTFHGLFHSIRKTVCFVCCKAAIAEPSKTFFPSSSIFSIYLCIHLCVCVFFFLNLVSVCLCPDCNIGTLTFD